MEFYSTQNKNTLVSLREAVFRGLPPDNGLYMPARIPNVPKETLEKFANLSFQEIAQTLTELLFEDDLGNTKITNIVDGAFDFPIELVEIEPGVHVLELFHGPTLAFKDFGARFMARLMACLRDSESREINILAATSGDTGTAVGQGFKGVEGVRVTLLYPSGKVSQIQEQQLTTIGNNVQALEIEGSFDDCQRMVKTAFLDPELGKQLTLSSANSINVARLIPQSFYYFFGFSRLTQTQHPIVFSVPSGNFGNLTAGILALRMGLPVDQFIAATNSNHIVPDYLASGLFEPKPSIMTISNAMDVGDPSNFARLQDLYGNVDSMLREMSGAWFTDEQTKESILDVFHRLGYTMCPHTAIGYRALKEFQDKNSSFSTGVLLSTAHPAKFHDTVEEVTGTRVEMPGALREALQQPKSSIQLAPDYEYLKDYLLS